MNSLITFESYNTSYIVCYVQRLFEQSCSFKTPLYCVTLHATSELPPIYAYVIAGLPVSILNKCIFLCDGWKRRRMKPKLSFWSRCDQELIVAIGSYQRSIFWLCLSQSQQWHLVTRGEINVESICYSNWILGQNLFVLIKVTNRYQNLRLVTSTVTRYVLLLIRQE